jgi:hypothetical protein
VLRRGIATTGGGLWNQTTVLCLLPVVTMSVCLCPCPCPCPCPPWMARRPRWLRRARRHGSCETNYSGLFWGPRSSAVVCRRHARPLAPRVSWLAGFETVRSALDPGPGPFYLSAPTSPPGPHVHMPTSPRRPLPRQLDLKCRPCPPARRRPLIHHRLYPSIPSTIACCDYCPLPLPARCTVLRHPTPRYPTSLEFWTAAPPEPVRCSCRSYLTSSPLRLHCLLYTSPALAT